jgi:hypothetical protein
MKGAVMRPFRLYSDTPSLPTSKVWAEIDTVALQNNYKILCDRIPDVRHICVVKADSYGHTSAICVDVLLDAGCDFFAVSCIEEAIEVRSICRAKNRHADILILGYTDPRYAKELCEHDIIQSVISKEHGLLLSREAETAGCRIRVHIALDTGMNRVGICARNDIECQSAAKDIKELIRKSGISVEGMKFDETVNAYKVVASNQGKVKINAELVKNKRTFTFTVYVPSDSTEKLGGLGEFAIRTKPNEIEPEGDGGSYIGYIDYNSSSSVDGYKIKFDTWQTFTVDISGFGTQCTEFAFVIAKGNTIYLRDMVIE